MNTKILRAAAVFLAAVLLLPLPAGALSAKSYCLYDAASGKVLAAQDEKSENLIASTTKIMTGLLICERGDLSQALTVPKQAVNVEGSGIYLQEGEKITVEALLYGMLLESGNDAATMLALYSDGSIPAFAARMNARARDLGLTHTHFENPHGLDAEGNYSCAEDLCRLAAFALKNPEFSEVSCTKSADFGTRHFVNHNKLLWQYPDTIGVKTGYTKKAGRILVSAVRRGGRTLVCATLSDPNDWEDHKVLYDRAFSSMKEVCAVKKQDRFPVPVLGGGYREAAPQEDLTCLLLPGETLTIQPQLPHFLFDENALPESAGTLKIKINGKEIDCLPLIWAKE